MYNHWYKRAEELIYNAIRSFIYTFSKHVMSACPMRPLERPGGWRSQAHDLWVKTDK